MGPDRKWLLKAAALAFVAPALIGCRDKNQVPNKYDHLDTNSAQLTLDHINQRRIKARLPVAQEDSQLKTIAENLAKELAKRTALGQDWPAPRGEYFHGVLEDAHIVKGGDIIGNFQFIGNTSTAVGNVDNSGDFFTHDLNISIGIGCVSQENNLWCIGLLIPRNQ